MPKMRVLIIFLILFSFSSTVTAQQNTSISGENNLVITSKFKVRNSHKLVKQLKRLPIFKNSLSGLCIYDVEKGEYIVEYNSERYFIPASNAKLFTFYSGLINISDRIPALYYMVNGDSLLVWGSGAPTLLNSEFEDSVVFNFFKNTNKEIYFSEANFNNKRYGLGWAWDDYTDEYSKEITPLPVYGNAVIVIQYPNGRWTVNPKQFKDSIEVKGYGSKFKLKRVEKENRFELWLSNSEDTLTKEVPFVSSVEMNLRLLSDSLHKKINLIDRELSEEVQVFYGMKTDSIYKIMLQDSDNYLAESVLMMSALGLSQKDRIKTSLQVKKILSNQLEDIAQQPRWVDGSGLSRYNLFTPQSMVEVLIKIRKKVLETDGNMKRVFDLLPTGGKTGTLKNRFTDYPEFIYAKTGSLSNNHNLSGYLVTKSGKLLIFSYMNNHYRYKTSTIQKQTDVILKDFYLYY
jgi:D-alanyl-D-alanine carboxypeptidase/D-alanyl-D-alanine-endopeptidase (penicillin-binding protein 4)